jgi:ABC-type multidrug transport system fused ATPase/permease subunit
VPQPPSSSPQEKKKLASLIPTKETTSSIRKLLELARPERQTIIWAIGLLIVSSTISMSVPLTIGKLIDFFASSDSVRARSLAFHL